MANIEPPINMVEEVSQRVVLEDVSEDQPNRGIDSVSHHKIRIDHKAYQSAEQQHQQTILSEEDHLPPPPPPDDDGKFGKSSLPYCCTTTRSEILPPYVFPPPRDDRFTNTLNIINAPTMSSSHVLSFNLFPIAKMKKKPVSLKAEKFNPMNYMVLYEEVMQCEAAREHFQSYLKLVHNEEPLLFLNTLNEYKQEYERARAEMFALVRRMSSCCENQATSPPTVSPSTMMITSESSPLSSSLMFSPLGKSQCSEHNHMEEDSFFMNPIRRYCSTPSVHCHSKLHFLQKYLHHHRHSSPCGGQVMEEEVHIFKRVLHLWDKLNEIRDLFIAPQSKYQLNLASTTHSKPLGNALTEISKLLNPIRPFLMRNEYSSTASSSKHIKEEHNSSNVMAALLELRRNSELSNRSTTSVNSGSEIGGFMMEDHLLLNEGENTFYSPCLILDRMNPEVLFATIEFTVNLDLSMDQFPRYSRSKELFTFLEEKGEEFTRSIALDISKGHHLDIRFKALDFHSNVITDRDIYFAYMLSKDTSDWEELSFSRTPTHLQTFISKNSHLIGQEKMNGLRLNKMVLHLPYNIGKLL